MEFRRLEGWEDRFTACVEGARGRAYTLGTSDCLRFACEVLQALTGLVIWEQFAGRYFTRKAAAIEIAKWGRNLPEAVNNFLAIEPTDYKQARRGDLVAFADAEHEYHLGACIGDKAMVLSESGLVAIPIESCACVWRIG